MNDDEDRASFRGDEKVLKLTVVIVARVCEYNIFCPPITQLF